MLVIGPGFFHVTKMIVESIRGADLARIFVTGFKIALVEFAGATGLFLYFLPSKLIVELLWESIRFGRSIGFQLKENCFLPNSCFHKGLLVSPQDYTLTHRLRNEAPFILKYEAEVVFQL